MIKECVKFVAFRRCMELAAQGYSRAIFHFGHYGSYRRMDVNVYDIAVDLAAINYELAMADFYYKLGTRVFGSRNAPTAAQAQRFYKLSTQVFGEQNAPTKAQVRRFMGALAQWKQRHNRPRQ